jgi:outer membrane protein assembly factor BamB
MSQTSTKERPTNTPPPLKKVTRRVTPPNLRLDPQGISGTATARRMRYARRRRQLQTLWVTVGGALTVIAASTFLGMQLMGFTSPIKPLHTTLVADLPFTAPTTASFSNGVAFVEAHNATLWKVLPDGKATKLLTTDFSARVEPVVHDSLVALGTLDGTISVVDADAKFEDEKLRWQRDLGTSISTRPLFVGNTLYCATDEGKVASLDANSGKVNWGVNVGGPIGEALTATSKGIVAPLLAGKSGRGGLVCLNPTNGAVIWRFPEGTRTLAAGTSAPFFDAKTNQIFWANDEGTIVALNANNGSKIWKTYAVAPTQEAPASAKPQPVVLRGAPALFGNTLLVGGNDGVLRAYDSRNGNLSWATKLSSPIVSPAKLAGEISVFVRTQSGESFIIGLSGGEILRRSMLSKWGSWNDKSGLDFTESGELIHVELS